MKKWFLILLVALFPAMAFSQAETESEVKWYNIQQALQLNKEHPKKILIYIYSDQCGWCKRMSGNTLTNPVIASYLNEKYYPVKLNKDMTEDIVFGSRTFKYVPADRSRNTPSYHEFVVYLLQGKMGWPSVAFLDKDTKYLGFDQGYKKPSDFEKLLHFIGDEAYLKTSNYEKYAEEFNGAL